ncbi:NAD(P)-binding protein [Asanoa sp. NPDC050611]|uniref:NAD(P)-binding protein n=1 Tax=Asanoa sp. NPDC050611 TaxID=3157098 RepID=UPI0033E035D3
MRHAVVLGAGIGGLFAAAALSEVCERVTVVERDRLPAGPAQRRGVPQGRHAHVLVTAGAQALDRLFPGAYGELVAAGAPVVRDFAEFRLAPGGGRPLLVRRRPEQPFACQVSRPCLEAHLRARLGALSNVALRDGAAIAGLTATGGRVTGVSLVRGDDVRADLVVDATGRGSRAPVWLAELGYPAPRVERVPIDLVYVTRQLRPSGALPAKVVGVSARPGRPRGIVLFAQEQGRAILTVSGYGGHHPPRDPAGLMATVAEIAPPDVLAALRAAEPLGDPVLARFPANVRLRYERLRRFPTGFLVLGDAICSTNPAYALGMSVAALQAEALRDVLLAGDHDLARRFFPAATRPARAAWQAAVGGDLKLPEVPGPRPLPIRLAGVYTGRLLRAAERDPVVAHQFLRVASLQDPATRLFRPSVAVRAALRGRDLRDSADDRLSGD